MLELFEYEDYRKFVRGWVASKPKNGHGQYRKIALHLRIAPVTISQIFRGDRELSIDAALPLAEFLGLGSLEKKYFLKLVLFSHAGTPLLKFHLQDEIIKIKSESQNLKNRVPSEISMRPTDLAIFHSSWIYSAVRLLTGIEEFQTLHAISKKLSIDVEKTEAILQFLVDCGLCERKGDRYLVGPSRTHLPEESPFIIPRQMSWRSRAAMRMHQQMPEELYYTAPMSIAQKDIPTVRREILKFIERVNQVVGPSEPDEELVCLNIDWFRVAPGAYY